VEREEVTKLRRRVLELEQERSILLKATVFFAKETTR
jgi:transposase-like protein